MKRRLFVIAVFAVGCSFEEAPGEAITGVVNGEGTVVMPLSGETVCVGALRRHSRSETSSSTSTTSFGFVPRWSENLSLDVSGTTYQITGTHGEPTLPQRGGEWKWLKHKATEPDKKLWGWGHDSTLNAITDPAITSSLTHVDLNEEFAKCGDIVTVRAIVGDATIELVDTNAADGRNALRGFALFAAGFFCFLIVPMILLIAFVVRRSMRKRSG